MTTSENEIDDVYAEIRRKIAGRENSRLARDMSLMYQVVQNHNLIRGKMDGLIKPYGMTLPGYNVLTLLRYRPEGLILKDLSRWLLVSKANITGLIRSLEKKRFIVRIRQGSDHRKWRVILTTKGKKTLGVYQTKHMALISKLSRGLTERDIETAARILSRWRQKIYEAK